MKKLLQFGPLFVITAALLWSLDGVFRISLQSLPPTVIVFYEHLVGLLLLVFVAKTWIADIKKITKKQLIAMMIVGIFSGALGTIFYTAALQKTQFIQYSVVVLLEQQLQPIWAILAASFLLKEKITKQFFLWALLAIISIYFVTFKDLTVNVATGQGTIIGGLLALGAGFMWGTSTAISKYALNGVSFMSATVLRFLFAPLFALLMILTTKQTSSLFIVSTQQWITILLIALTTGMVAVVIYYYGLKKVQAKASAIFELAFPGAAIFIDYFFYHHALSITQIVGIIILVFATYKVVQLNQQEVKQKSAKHR